MSAVVRRGPRLKLELPQGRVNLPGKEAGENFVLNNMFSAGFSCYRNVARASLAPNGSKGTMVEPMQPENSFSMERRSKARFPLNLSVRYRSLSGNPSLVGEGRTVNMSSCGLLIAPEAEAQVQTGARLQLTVDWPLRLHGTTPLQLIVSCRVTRSDPDEFAVKLEQYLFRTRRLRSQGERLTPLFKEKPLF